MNANLTKMVNEKLVFCLPKNIIYYLPHNKKPITDEMVVRLVLTIPEPDEKLSNEDKIKYHQQKNTEFIKQYKSLWKDLIFTDISYIDSEVWLGFKTISEDIINELTKLDEVCCIYLYNLPRTNGVLTTNLYVANEQASILKELKKKLELINALPKDNVVNDIEDGIEVDDSYYDPKTKTLTLNLIGYKSDAAVEQLFAYLSTKPKNYEAIIHKLAVEILVNLSYYRKKPIARINFVIDDSDWPENSPNRYFKIFPPNVGDLSNKKSQDSYLKSSIYFNENISEKEMEDAIKFTLNYYHSLFYAVTVKPLDIIELLSKLDPKQITLDKIEKHPTDAQSLHVKLNVFDTQQKMNLLYAYLASEPYNKEHWIKHLKNLILDGLKKANLGKINTYHFVTFDNLDAISNIDVSQASIGGINLSQSYYDLDNDNTEVKELFLDLSKNFASEDELEIYINRNLQWNRHTYLNYYFKDSIVFDYGNRVKRAISGNSLNKTYWDIFNNLKNSLNPKYLLNNDTLTIELNGFKNLEEFKVLLYLINNDNKNSQNSQNWATKLADIIQTGLRSVNATLRSLKFLYVAINGNLNDKLLLLDLTELDSKTSSNLETVKPNVIKQFLFTNLKRINSDLILTAINVGIVASGLEDMQYALQYMTVGLGSFFNASKANKITFDNSGIRVGVLEADNGIILPFRIEHFNSSNLITNTQDGRISSHSDLVGRIVGSTTEGVDNKSVIVSAGFEFSGANSYTSWNALKAIDWMVQQDIKLLNCSWGLTKKKASDPDFVTYSELAYKIDYITRKYGIVVFKSTGNDHEKFKPYFRAVGLAFNTISVGSTSANGHKLSVFSDYEKLQSYKITKEAPKPLLVAPGEAYMYKGHYFDGTSFATPLVTGTASLLMREYSKKLEHKPAAMMAVLAASSDDRYDGTRNNNGLKYETGAGLLNYNAARSAASNVVNLEVENNLEVGKPLYVSGGFTVLKGQTISMGTAALYNGGYVTSIDLPQLKPTKGGISSAPIIGYLYLTYAYIYNNYQTSSFRSQFIDSNGKMLKMDKSIDVNNLDTYLMPVNITAVLQKYYPTTRKWTDVSWDNPVTAEYSNIKKYEHTNKETTCLFRYAIKVSRSSRHITGDHTKNLLAFTHVIKN